MTNRLAGAIVLVVLAQGVAACTKGGLIGGPTPPGEIVSIVVNTVVPKTGLIGSTVRISGVGFVSGATVRLGGEATNVMFFSTTLITATTPVNGSGTVDVIVTNPSGQSATLAGGYTYDVVTLTASATEVAPGDQLSVSWVVPSGRSGGDWVGLFRVGQPSTSYLDVWWDYTNDTTSGTLTLIAPTEPGQYEFRYLLDDGFLDAARIPVTVRSIGE